MSGAVYPNPLAKVHFLLLWKPVKMRLNLLKTTVYSTLARQFVYIV
jgi:hypothetical protein